MLVKIPMKKILFVVALAVLSSSCKKEGPGGEAELSVFVKHHGKAIPGSIVYIKYGADEFPGEDVTKYDDSKVTETSGALAGHAHFPDLRKGDYYLYAVGLDSISPGQVLPVKGGIPVEVKSKSGEIDVDVPVSED